MSQASSHRILTPTIIGYILSVLLTVGAYWLVTHQVALTYSTLYVSLAALALVQTFLQLFLFMRIGKGEDAAWNVATLIVTIIIISIVMIGSLWIMYNLNYNMVH